MNLSDRIRDIAQKLGIKPRPNELIQVDELFILIRGEIDGKRTKTWSRIIKYIFPDHYPFLRIEETIRLYNQFNSAITYEEKTEALESYIEFKRLSNPSQITVTEIKDLFFNKVVSLGDGISIEKIFDLFSSIKYPNLEASNEGYLKFVSYVGIHNKVTENGLYITASYHYTNANIIPILEYFETMNFLKYYPELYMEITEIIEEYLCSDLADIICNYY